MKDDLRKKYSGLLPDDSISRLEASAEKREAYLRLVNALVQDYEAILLELNAEQNNQLRRRTLARTMFAMVEGTIFALKQLTLEKYHLEQCELSPAEHALLSEESYDLKDKGEPRTMTKFLRLDSNIRFALSIYAAKVAGIEYKLDTSVAEWEKFRKAIDIRNRLMHPKSETEFVVTDDEMACLVVAASGFKETVGRLALQTWFTIQQQSGTLGRPK